MYRTEDGLPSCFVNSVFQDSRDFLWVCTDAGLCRYDGRKFVTYSLREGLQGARVVFVKEDNNGNLWIVTMQGLHKFDGRKFTNISFQFPVINDILIDGDKIWVGTKKGLYLFDIKTSTAARQNDFPAAKASGIIKRKDGTVVIGTNTGIVTYKNGYQKFWTPADPEYILGLAEDKNGYLWFCTLNGNIYCSIKDTTILMKPDIPDYDAEAKQSMMMSHSDLNGSIIVTKNNEVIFGRHRYFNVFKDGSFVKNISGFFDDKYTDALKAMQDREGNYWLSTLNGLLAIRPEYIKTYCPPLTSVHGIYKLKKDTNVYISNGLSVYKFANDTFVSPFPNMPALAGNITFFTKTSDAQFIFGTEYNSLFSYKNGRWKDLGAAANGSLYSMINEDDSILVGADNKVLIYKGDSLTTLNRKNGDSNVINAFFILPVQGTNDHLIGSQLGLYRFNNGIYTQLKMPFGDQRLSIHYIYDCKDGTYLLGTYGRGLLRVKIGDATVEVLSALTKDNGLGTDYVAKILLDGSTVWLAGKNGVYKVTNYFRHPDVEYINADDGMPKNSWLNSSIYLDDNGYVYVGGSEGLAKFDKNTSFTSQVISHTYITDITVNNTAFHWKKPDSSISFTGIPANYTFTHDNNSLIFYFTGINLSRPSRIKYEYQLVGYQNNLMTTSEDHVVFNNLSHGDYLFKVRSTANQSFTTEPYAVFKFTVKSPFWLTWWFSSIALVVLISCAYAFYKWRLNEQAAKQRRELEVVRQLNESKILAFQARMNPHFIFNSLAAIQYFITKNDNLSTLKYLSKFARLLRQILDNTKESKITLGNEISMLKSYVEIEEMRFENRFGYEITVADGLADSNIEIPGMIIQPFVENAILHGLLHKPDKGWLKINFETNGKQIICTVEDNGIGRKQSGQLNEKKTAKHRSHGSSIAIDTLQLLNDTDKGIFNEVVFVDKEEHNISLGTKVIIKIPIS